MNKYYKECFLVLILLLGLKTVIHAQTSVWKGNVVDHQSKLGIEGVTISTQDQGRKAQTDDNGDFSIELEENQNHIVLSHPAYQTREIDTQGKMPVLLQLKETELEAVIAFTEPLAKVFYDAFENALRPKKSGDVYQTYAREFMWTNGEVTNVADGLLDYYIKKPKQSPLVVLKEHRVLESLMEIPRGSDEAILSSALIGGLGDIRDFFTSNTGVNAVREVLDSPEEYDYVLKQNKGETGNEITVSFKPKANVEGWKYYEGQIVFTQDHKQILSYHYALAKAYHNNRKTINALLFQLRIDELSFQGVYKERQGKYDLYYLAQRMDYRISHKRIGDNVVSMLREVVVDDVIQETNLPTKSRLKAMNIFQNPSKYQTEYWKNRVFRPLTDGEERVLQQLQTKETK